MATEDTLVICDLATLQMWRHKLRSNMWTRNLPTVQFQLPEFSYEQNNNLAALASGFQGACGCASGGFFMSVAVVATIGSYFMSGSRFANVNLPQVVSFLGITVLAALSGKILGLFWARWRLLRLAAHTHDTIIRANQQTATQSI